MAKNTIRRFVYAVSLPLTLCASPAFAQVTPASAVASDLPITPYGDIRYRLEMVDQDGLPRNATASTLRIRAGIKTRDWHGLSAVVEADAILSVGSERFNDTINGKAGFPIVADPEDVVLNQAFVRWKPDERVEMTGGRQTVNLDNQRWIGSVAWRQNDQTFDSFKVSTKPVANLAFDYLYIWRVNRVFGPDSPQGIWRNTEIHGARAAYSVKSLGMVSGYAYWLNIPSAPLQSSRTFGLRFVGEQPIANKAKLTYAAEFARQSDNGANPLDFNHDYWLIEPGISLGPTALKLGYEHLGGDGRSALQTPLATLHAFNGWADKFLTTPPNGLRDIYLDLGHRLKKTGPFKGTTFRLAFHDFHSTRLGIDYGSEWNALVTVPVRKNITFLAKLARFNADRFATDTTKAWLSLEARF
jgi:hypothetical protein